MGSNYVKVAVEQGRILKARSNGLVMLGNHARKLSSQMQVAFYQSELDQPHPERTRAILRAHPEVRQLIGRNPFTAVIMVLVLSMQTAIGFGMGRLGWNFRSEERRVGKGCR